MAASCIKRFHRKRVTVGSKTVLVLKKFSLFLDFPFVSIETLKQKGGQARKTKVGTLVKMFWFGKEKVAVFSCSPLLYPLNALGFKQACEG